VNEVTLKDDDGLIPTRQSLLSRLKDWNDQKSWQVFFETYWKLIYRTAVKAGLTEPEAQDVVQETVISVCRSMPGFQYDPAKGSFSSWLLRVTAWRITDQVRKRDPAVQLEEPESPTETETSTTEQVPDPAGVGLETMWNEEWERNLMEAATQRVRLKVDPRHYQIFDCYVIKAWPVAQVIETFRISRGRLYLIKHRISRLIRHEIEQLRDQPL